MFNPVMDARIQEGLITLRKSGLDEVADAFEEFCTASSDTKNTLQVLLASAESTQQALKQVVAQTEILSEIEVLITESDDVEEELLNHQKEGAMPEVTKSSIKAKLFSKKGLMAIFAGVILTGAGAGMYYKHRANKVAQLPPAEQ